MEHGFSRYIVPVDICIFFTEVGDSNCFYRVKYTILGYIQMLVRGFLQTYSYVDVNFKPHVLIEK